MVWGGGHRRVLGTNWGLKECVWCGAGRSGGGKRRCRLPLLSQTQPALIILSHHRR